MMTTHIAFDFTRKQVREKITANKRTRVISHPAKSLLNRPVIQVWRMWLRFNFKFVSYRNGVLILEQYDIGNEPLDMSELEEAA